ncbi:MAG: nucleotidyltransferase domain-containing protein [Deltaproteobacteria bacterium CG_4_9_14_3_um_filter_65_9]|nr:MAG: nucleotidyltransferase domain-containing protein [Deltaproteobacteria bacterium CG_4_9_14_3_um_filter_65_9]
MSTHSGKIAENGRDDDLIIETLRGALPDLAAIYRFGSTATGQAGKDSDVDIAVLPAAPLEPTFRWTLQERLAVALHRSVDLVDLLQASTVMRMQVLESAILLFDGGPAARLRFETAACSGYARLNEERRAILDQVRREGTVYGR